MPPRRKRQLQCAVAPFVSVVAPVSMKELFNRRSQLTFYHPAHTVRLPRKTPLNHAEHYVTGVLGHLTASILTDCEHVAIQMCK